MKTKVLVGVLIFLVLVNVAVLGTYLYWRYVDRPSGRFPDPSPETIMMEQMRSAEPFMMRLTPEQREKMHALMEEFRDETRPIHEKITDLEDKTFAMLQRDTVPMDDVENNLRQLADLRFQMSRRATERLIKAKSFLTPEQQRMFYGSITQARPRFGPMMGPQGFGGRRGMGFRGRDSLR